MEKHENTQETIPGGNKNDWDLVSHIHSFVFVAQKQTRGPNFICKLFKTIGL